jgi:hypothetical protein
MKGDQIGRIFAFLAIVCHGQLLKITEVARFYGPLFTRQKFCFNFETKMGWNIRVLFSPTHLVTLLPAYVHIKAYRDLSDIYKSGGHTCNRLGLSNQIRNFSNSLISCMTDPTVDAKQNKIFFRINRPKVLLGVNFLGFPIRPFGKLVNRIRINTWSKKKY